jgi:lipoyl(octanoyl) transferase
MTLLIRQLGCTAYADSLHSMQQHTKAVGSNQADELWLLQHSPVFTQGIAGKNSDIINHHDIPVIASDRGGLITYHGPGQLVAYTLFNLNRLKLGPKCFVAKLEIILIKVLQHYQIKGHRRPGAPGIYVDNKKIASIGLRVRKGFCYHGIALNVDMDLTPFSYINPCGFSQLEMTQMKNHTNLVSLNDVSNTFAEKLCTTLNYKNVNSTTSQWESPLHEPV